MLTAGLQQLGITPVPPERSKKGGERALSCPQSRASPCAGERVLTLASQQVHLVPHAAVVEVVIQEQAERLTRGCRRPAPARGGEQPLPPAAGQEALPGRAGGGVLGGCQRAAAEQRPQEALQALQQLPPAPLPTGQLRRKAAGR